jgi:hypothetical protein
LALGVRTGRAPGEHHEVDVLDDRAAELGALAGHDLREAGGQTRLLEQLE